MVKDRSGPAFRCLRRMDRDCLRKEVGTKYFERKGRDEVGTSESVSWLSPAPIARGHMLGVYAEPGSV